jgi:hypothetical protein
MTTTIQVQKADRVTRPLFAPAEFVSFAFPYSALRTGQIIRRWWAGGWCYAVSERGGEWLLSESILRPAQLCCWCDEPATARTCGDLACEHHRRVYDTQNLAQFAEVFSR